MIYSGYGILVKDELVYTIQGGSIGTVKIVRDRDYPDGKLVHWAQGMFTPTVYNILEESSDG